MRLRIVVLVAFVVATLFAWACSLNPQPLPPDTIDSGSKGALDGSFAADVGTSGDGALTDTPESGAQSDADASDATTDAEDAMTEDASDASDASEDANDAGDASEEP